jgi:tetratricopeptide (TPR) repeat protein
MTIRGASGGGRSQVRTALVFCVAAAATLSICGTTAAAQTSLPDDPDALYAMRQDWASATRAADLWEQHASTSYEAAWKLARVCYWLSSHGPTDGRRRQLERGVSAGENAVRLLPDQPEGHFWLSVDMGRLAQAAGLRAGLRYRGRIKSEIERVLSIDARYENGSADAVLGEWYRTVPRLFGGSHREAEVHYRRALDINPRNAPALQYYAQFLEADGRPSEARELWERLRDEEMEPNWIPEGKEYKQIAADHLARLPAAARANAGK